MKHIFLLEDDEALGRGISMALTGSEVSVVCRPSLTKAREALTENRFDLLILDVNLPDGSGLTLPRQVRSEGDATPVILLTANDLELDEVTGLEAGADDYVTKPFSLAVLQSIGMTGRQLRTMLALEGLFYTLGATLLALVLIAATAPFIGPGLNGLIWFFTYRFTVWPIGVVLPLFGALGILIPVLSCRAAQRYSVVDRLRQE